LWGDPCRPLARAADPHWFLHPYSVDLVICGSVAVNLGDAHLGKVSGYSDLEYALACVARRLPSDTPILATVHGFQLIEEAIPREVHDIAVDYIVAPAEVVDTHTSLLRPEVIHWKLLSLEKIEAFPALRGMAACQPDLA
jgi:5-formyltetrahydrofolate cyclo-ligase